MPITTRNLLDQYTEILQKIYGKHLKKVILYGSYARGDYRDDSDIDIMRKPNAIQPFGKELLMSQRLVRKERF